MKSKLSFTSLLALVALFGAGYAACGGDTNADERQIKAAHDDGGVVDPDAGDAAPTYEARSGIFPDDGPRPPNCAATQGLDLAVVIDFEGNAPGWFKFEDGTALTGQQLLPVEAMGVPAPAYFGLETVPIERCGAGSALHIQGGPFTAWGGGVGTFYFKLPNAELAALYGLTPGELFSPQRQPSIDPATGEQVYKGLDASAYQGVSFWARRGNTGQASLRIEITDRYTNSDAARIQYNAAAGPVQAPDAQIIPISPPGGPFCGRVEVCIPEGGTCTNGKPCSPITGGFACYDPSIDPEPTLTTQGVVLCNCTGVADELDVLHDNKPCVPYVFSDLAEQNVCYDQALDPLPPEENERCDNAWTTIVNVGPDWKFYRIPWAELGQSDTLLQSPGLGLDPSSIWAIRFGFTSGVADYYVDDIGFYR